MTYKKKLVKFVKLKKVHIEKFGFIYADHRDYEDIKSWTEEKCKEIYSAIVNNITIGSHGLSDLTCPWCIYRDLYNLSYSPCFSCSYGKRHGECLKNFSSYKKYATIEVKYSLTDKVYQDIINKIES